MYINVLYWDKVINIAIITFTPSVSFVTITILPTFSCQIICQKSLNVIFFGPGMQSIHIWLYMYCPWRSNYLEMGISLSPIYPRNICVSVASQNLDFYCHMSWSFICSMRLGKRWLSVFLILMELSTITAYTFFYYNRHTHSKLTMKQQKLFFILMSLIVSLLDV